VTRHLSQGSPAASRGRRWAVGALTATFFVLLAVINTYPLAFTPGAAIGEHGDAYFSTWRLAWIAHQLWIDPGHLFDGNIFYPETGTLAYSDAILLPGMALSPLHWLGFDPIVVYNVTLIAAFALGGIAAYHLVRHLTGSAAAGLLGGVIYAFSPHRFDHFDHLEMQFAFWIPLAVLAWHRAVERESIKGYLQTSALAAAQVLSCIYYGVFLLTWLAVLTALWFLRTPAKAVKAWALVLMPALVILAIYSLPYLQNRSKLGDRRESDVTVYSASAGDFLSAPSTNRLYGWSEPLGAPERHLFPGLIVIALVIVGLWPPFNRVRLLHAAGLAMALELAFGFNGHIYRFLYDWVLPFRGLRVPARADILVLLGTSVLAGFGFVRIVARANRRAVAALIAMVLVGLTSIECLHAPRLNKVDREIPAWYSWLRTVPDAVVFEWPVTVPSRLYNMVDVTYMYRSTMNWRPMLNGYSGYYPRAYLQLLEQMRSFPDSRSLNILRRRGATMLVLHEVRGSRPSYVAAAERLLRDPYVEVIAQDRDGAGRISFFRLLPRPTPASSVNAPRPGPQSPGPTQAAQESAATAPPPRAPSGRFHGR
jgi:hypothetical protein